MVLEVRQAKLYDKLYCWNLVCKPVHRMFEELYLVRSVDRDAFMGSDTGIFLTPTRGPLICACATIAKFVKYEFDDNPAMSAATT